MRKRILALICSIALFCGSISAYANFSDMPENANETRIVNILNKIGIMNGYEDGTFKPSQAITRSEFSTLLYKSIGYLNISSESGGDTETVSDSFNWRQFFLGSDSNDQKLIYPEEEKQNEDGITVTNGPWKDIEEGYWAYGYLQSMKDLGIVSGYEDNTFRPENTVTYNEAIKIILNICGYKRYADGMGGYPDGYRKIAEENKLHNGISSSGNAMMSRMDAATLIYNSFKVKLAPEADMDGKQDRNFLNDIVGVYTVEGMISATDITSVYGGNPCYKKTAKIGDISFTFEDDMTDIRDYIGRDVRAFLKKDKSDDSYSLMIFEPTSRDDVTVINNADLEKFENNTFTYRTSEESSKTKKITIRNGSAVIYNGKYLDGYSKETFEDIGNGTITVIKKSNADFDVVFAEAFETGYTETKNEKKKELTDSLAENDAIIKFDRNLNQDEVVYSIYDGGKNIIEFESVGEGAINYYRNEEYLKMYYSTATVSGTISSKYEKDDKTYLKIGGNEYAVSKRYYEHSGASIMMNADVTAVLDSFGEIAWIANGSAALEGYAYFIRQYKNDAGDALTIEYYDLDANKVTQANTVSAVRLTNQKGESAKVNAEKLADTLDGYDGAIKIFKNENEEIERLELPRNSDSEDASALKLVLESNDQSTSENYRDNLRYLSGIRSFSGKAYINEGTKILNVPQNKTDYNYYSLSDYKLLKTESYLFKLYSFDADSPYVKLAILSKAKSTNYFDAGNKLPTYFVLSRTTAVNADNEIGVKLQVTDGETTSEFFAPNEDEGESAFDKAMNAFNEPAKLKVSPGDFVHIAVDDVNNEVVNARIVFDADGLNPAWCGADPADNITEWPADQPHSNTILGTIPGSTGFAAAKDYKTNPVGYTSGVSGGIKTPGNTGNWQMWMYGFVYSFKEGLMEITSENIGENFNGTPDRKNYSCYFYDPNIAPAKYYLIHGNKNGYTIEKGGASDVRAYTQVGESCSRCVFNLAGGTMRAVWIFEEE